jgi:hypothetical protein
MRGPKLLAEWMAANGHELISASNALMTTMGEVRRVLSGKDVPHQSLAERIAEWTGGAVPLDAWEVECDFAMTHAEIAEHMGLTRQQVQRIESAAMNKLRRHPEAKALWMDVADVTEIGR